MRIIQAIAIAALAAVLTIQQQLQQANAEAQNQRDYGRRQVEQDDASGEDLSQMADSRLSFSVATAAASNNANSPAGFVQCEQIEFSFCASMPYNYTRMANFFGDSNQIEAADRAKQYERLASTACSRHLHAYLCELLAPMCLTGDAMKKFEIFPCRSFCRQVSRECEAQITSLFMLQYGQPLPSAFQCDKLRFESNGGNGSGDRGPCHETPEVAAGIISGPHVQAAAPSLQANTASKRPPVQYRPYQNDELNVPPFVDNSLIDSRIIRPISPLAQPPPPTTRNNNNNNNNEQPQVWAQLQQLGQQLAAALLRHSNVLTILALVCLVLVLNAKRLQRLKVCLSSGRRFNHSNSSSSRKSSSSTSSSSGSQRKLAANVHRKLTQLSPSASSRSLMLLAAGGCDGKQRIQSTIEPSQKLLLNQANQRTLINVNGTLERQQDARYHLMQSMNAAAAAAAAGQQGAILAAKHHYDYIQVPVGGGRHSSSKSSGRGSGSCAQLELAQQQQQQQQVYDNILLSSPSHQILLFGDQQPRPRGARDTPPPPPASMPPHSATSYASPYAAGSLIGVGGGGRSFQRRPSVSGNGANSLRGSHHRLGGGNSAQLPPPPPPAQYASSTASSTASSSGSGGGGGGGGSSASSFSPPANLTTGLLLTPRSSRLS